MKTPQNARATNFFYSYLKKYKKNTKKSKEFHIENKKKSRKI